MEGNKDIRSVILKLGFFVIFLGLVLFAFGIEFAGKIIALIGILIAFFGGLGKKLGLGI
jgi:vacuolar-type H+-ATPase subunit I/STV1